MAKYQLMLHMANGAIITHCQLPHGAIIEIKMFKKTCDYVLRVRHVNLKGRGLALSSCFANDK